MPSTEQEKSVLQTATEAIAQFKALTFPKDFNTLAEISAPKNKGQADHQRKLANIVEERVRQFNELAADFFKLADDLRVDIHQAEKDVKLARKRARMAELSRGEKTVVRTYKAHGSAVAQAIYDALKGENKVKLSFDELCEAANTMG